MKKSMSLLCAFTLICASIAACDKTITAKKTQPVSADENVSSFFKENLQLIIQSIFNKDEMDSMIDGCVMINSVDEYWKFDLIEGITDELPEIDFDAYTLIIGQCWQTAGCSIQNHYITTEDGEMVLNLILKKSGNAPAYMNMLYYWGLYPKFDQASIRVNLINEK